LVGIGLLWFGSDQTTRSATFVQTSGFDIWAVSIGVQTAYWAIVAGPLWVDFVQSWRVAREGRFGTVLIAAILTVILVVVPIVSAAADVRWPLWGQTVKIRVLTLVGGLAVGVPALSAIALIQLRVSRHEAELAREGDVATALRARSQILRFLSVAGAVIGLAVLGAGALRKATVPAFVADSELPQEGILLYGAFFTGLLLLVYVPAHLALRGLGLRIRDRYFALSEMPVPRSDSFKGWLEKRAALENLLQLNITPSQQLQASLFILAPIISAIFTALAPRAT